MDFSNISALENSWITQSKRLNKTVVLPEAEFSKRVLNAGLYCAKEGICNVVLLSKSNKLDKYASDRIRVVNILSHEISSIVESAYFIKRQHKGVTKEQAHIDATNVYMYGSMMVDLGLVDGMVAGAEAPSKEVLGWAFKTVKAKDNAKASAFFIMLPNGEGKPYLLADCAININPSATELADIAKQSAHSYNTFVGKTPKVALLSYSTLGSADGESAEKVRECCKLLKGSNFIFDGEMQLDSAVNKEVAKLKCPNSSIKGDANVLVFPDLQSGNIGYKIMQRFGNYKAIGPLVQGLNKPINDLSRGASEEEIVLSMVITALQS